MRNKLYARYLCLFDILDCDWFVCCTQATDRDQGSNANIVYSLKAVEDYAK
jgi:hypothetical protein